MLSDQQKIQQLFDFSVEIAHVQDFDVLMEKILYAARKLVNADAGYIYLRQGNILQCYHTQNATLQKQLPPEKKLILPTFSIPLNERSVSGYVATTGETVNIPDVAQVSAEIPYTLDNRYDEIAHYHTKSFLVAALKHDQHEIVGVMHLLNAQNDAGEAIPFSDDDIPLIKIFANHVVMSIERTQMTRARILEAIRLLKELRDPEETAAHVNRVGAYSAEIYTVWARRKGIPHSKIEIEAELLRMAAMLHDLGKLALPEGIREKPGRLTPEEFEIMKQHSVKGAQILLKSPQSEYEKAAAEIALNHHECWDGSGYPGHVDPQTEQAIPGYEDGQGNSRGKQGEEIPVFGRVVAIADVYDALSCRRAYRKALEASVVLDILRKEAGKHFDPEMIDAFFACLDTLRAIAPKFPDEEE